MESDTNNHSVLVMNYHRQVIDNELSEFAQTYSIPLVEWNHHKDYHLFFIPKLTINKYLHKKSYVVS